MRTLYYVPIMHSLEELGSLAKPAMEIEKRVHGPQAEKNYKEKTNRFWAEVTGRLKKRELNTPEKCKKMHIYADGLTAQPFYCKTCFDKTGEKRYMDEITSNEVRCSFCGRVAQAAVEEFLSKLVRVLIEKRFPLYLIIEKLMERGARIHGTESQALLIEERNMWVNIAKGIDTNLLRKAELLIERDEFIARRINGTLPQDGTAILFIGSAHRVGKELQQFPDIKVIYL